MITEKVSVHDPHTDKFTFNHKSIPMEQYVLRLEKNGYNSYHIIHRIASNTPIEAKSN